MYIHIYIYISIYIYIYIYSIRSRALRWAWVLVEVARFKVTCTVYSVQRVMYCVQCTIYSVLCFVYCVLYNPFAQDNFQRWRRLRWGLRLLVLGSGFKIRTKCARMRPWRVQNRAPEGPKRRPRAQDGSQEATQSHPKSVRDAIVPLGARQVDARMRLREPKAARARFCVPFLDPDGAPRSPKWVQKANQKWFEKHLGFRSRFGIDLNRFGSPKGIILGAEKGSKCMQRL